VFAGGNIATQPNYPIGCVQLVTRKVVKGVSAITSTAKVLPSLCNKKSVTPDTLAVYFHNSPMVIQDVKGTSKRTPSYKERGPNF